MDFNIYEYKSIKIMKYIKSYQSYKDQKINEEFVGKLIKGSLGKLFQAFSAPFKDLVNDIKKSFKEDDPNSIKGIVMTNLNQAIDSAQKMIRDKSITNKSDVSNIMNTLITTLTDLANNIGKDFSSAIPDKLKASAASEIAKAILIGSEEAGWKGIIGYLNDKNYKYSKPKYEQSVNAVQNPDELKKAQNVAFTFLDNFQKDISNQLNTGMSEEEMKKIYNESVERGGGAAKFDFDKLEEFRNKKIKVKYKMKGYDNNKAPQLQANKIGEKLIEEIDKSKESLIFIGKNNERIEKNFSDILGPVEGQEKKPNNLNQDVTNNLKELSKDPKNIEVIKKVTDAIKSDPNIISKIDEILPKEEVKTD